MITAIVFDFDGVIADSEVLHLRAYQEVLAPLVQEEVRVLLDRVAGEVSVERAVEIVASGAEPLRDLIGAMHSKLLLAELR